MLHVCAVRRRLRLTSAIALAAALVLAAGCGNDSGHGKLLSRATAADLRATLDQVQQDVANGDCGAASSASAQLQQDVNSVRGLDSSLRGALRASATRLQSLVETRCQTPTTPTVTTPTETQPTQPPGKTKDKGKGKEQKPGKGQTGTTDQGGSTPPGQQDGGGAGLPGESNGQGNGNGN
jgi:hypothetical protein